MKFKRIAIDTSKHVFTLHGVDEPEHPVLRRDLEHGEVDAILTAPQTGLIGGGADPRRPAYAIAI